MMNTVTKSVMSTILKQTTKIRGSEQIMLNFPGICNKYGSRLQRKGKIGGTTLDSTQYSSLNQIDIHQQ